jgi:transposase
LHSIFFVDKAEAQLPISDITIESNGGKAGSSSQKSSPGKQMSGKSCDRSHRPPTCRLERDKLSNSKSNKRKARSKKSKSSRGQKFRPKSQPVVAKPETSGNTSRSKVTVSKIERVDDVPVLIKTAIKAGIQHAIDAQIPQYKNQRSLSWGQTAVIWLAYILTTGDHRKVSVQEYVKNMSVTLSQLIGVTVNDQDFADDRLSVLLRHLGDDIRWAAVEHAISENTVEAYELPTEVVRVDATTVSGYHETAEGELLQFGHSKDDQDLPQIKIMSGALDPMGMPLASDVVSGEHADDGLYCPVIGRIASVLRKKGLVYVGDCKLSSFENRLYIRVKAGGNYLCPLPKTGKIPEHMKQWIADGNAMDKEDQLIEYVVINSKGDKELKAKGYEITREQSGELDGREVKWTERVLIIKSLAHAHQQEKALETRLKKASEKLLTLTPPVGRGKKQIVNKKELLEKAEAVLKSCGVTGLLEYTYRKETKKETRYVGRGRGSADREMKTIKKVRFQITGVKRKEVQIIEKVNSFGWKTFVTDASSDRLCFGDVIRMYRNQYRVEQVFNKLKSRLNIAPLYVKRSDQIKGMTNLLTLAVRVYTLIEYVVRRSLAEKKEAVSGLYCGNPKKSTDKPTYEKILKAFSNISLTIFKTENGVEKQLIPLNQTQTEILRHLGMEVTIYTDLEKIKDYG